MASSNLVVTAKYRKGIDMSLAQVLGLVCIILGFVVGITEEKILFDALSWFVAGIAFIVVLGGVGPIIGKR